MKKTFYLLASLLVCSCSMFELDNYDGPDAQVTGRLVDAKTGGLIGIECQQSSAFSWEVFRMITTTNGTLVVEQQGWDAVEDQDWFVRFDGKYTNNLVFAGDYKVSTKKLPCYQPEDASFSLKKGANEVDFTLTPYCRIVNPSIRYEASSKKVIATFTVELGDASKAGTIQRVALCGNTMAFVGCNWFNLCANDPGAVKTNVTPGETVTLELDTTLGANVEMFKYDRERYFRIAALATGDGYNSSSAYNFSPVFVSSVDFGSFKEFDWNAE